MAKATTDGVIVIQADARQDNRGLQRSSADRHNM